MIIQSACTRINCGIIVKVLIHKVATSPVITNCTLVMHGQIVRHFPIIFCNTLYEVTPDVTIMFILIVFTNLAI